MAEEKKKDSILLGCMVLFLVIFFSSLGIWKFVDLIVIIINHYRG